MSSDEPTLPESIAEELLRAGFDEAPEYAELVQRCLLASDPRHRMLALRAAVRRGVMTIPDWSRAIADQSRDVRREALQLVAYEPNPGHSILGAVVAALDDPDPLVTEGAAFALGELQHRAAVLTLCRVASEHEDARCREAAVGALGALGDEGGRATIVAALEDKAPIRRRAIVALANFEGPDIDAALARAREDRDWQVRAAVNQLGRDED